jgi:hypothetical protein
MTNAVTALRGPLRVSVWQLADDWKTYGLDAGKFILVTPDGADEWAGVFATSDEAEDYATQRGRTVVPLNVEG